MHLIVWCTLCLKPKAIEAICALLCQKIIIIQAIYQYYDSTPINSFMFQFAAPYGLKNALVKALLELILIEYSLFSVKKSCFFYFNFAYLIWWPCSVMWYHYFSKIKCDWFDAKRFDAAAIWLGFCIKHLSGLLWTKIIVGRVNCLVSTGYL